MLIKPTSKLLLFFTGIALLFPLFLQYSSIIYTGDLYDSGGNIQILPIPISFFYCFFIFCLVFRHLRKAYISLAFIVASTFLMALPLLFESLMLQPNVQKGILLAQILMPMIAVILGQILSDDETAISKGFLIVLLLIVPFQLVAGWAHGTLSLTHNLYLFSIYQQFQYVPHIFICAYIFAITSLWGKYRSLLCFLSFIMAIYTVASSSYLAIAIFFPFITFFIFSALKINKNIPSDLAKILIILSSTILALCVIRAYFAIAQITDLTFINGMFFGKFQSLYQNLYDYKLPDNFQERLKIWHFYGNRIIQSYGTVFFGHTISIDRNIVKSAHNYYIDIVYNFGIISLLPMLVLVGYTFNLVRKCKSNLSLGTKWHAFVVFYLVLIDANFKATLYQPYSGIFTYFLWGLLLSRLHRTREYPL